MDQLEDLVKDFQTPKVAKVNLKALRDRDEASGRLVVDAFTPRFVDLEQRLDRLERNSRKTFRRDHRRIRCGSTLGGCFLFAQEVCHHT